MNGLSMEQAMNIQGEWWLPISPALKRAGTLTFFPGQQLLLKLHSCLEDKPQVRYESQAMILGVSPTVGNLTLTGCWGKASPTGSEYTASTLLVGQHFPDPQDIGVEWMAVRFHNLEEVVGLTTIEEPHFLAFGEEGHPSPYRLNQVPASSQTARLGEFRLRTETCFGTSGTPFATREVHNRTFLIFEADTEKKIDEFWEGPVRALHYLVELIVMQAVPILQIVCGNKRNPFTNPNGEIEYPEMSVLQSWQPNRLPLPARRPVQDLLLTLRSLGEGFGDALDNYYQSYERLRPAFDLSFNVLRNPSMPPYLQFLSLSQALEFYHRCNYLNEDLPLHEHLAWLSTFLNVGTPEARKRLERKLRYSNEPSLRKRVNQVFMGLPDQVQERLGKRKSFVNRLVNTRHYYTHYDESLKQKALSGADLLECCQQLRGLLTILCLRLLKLDDERICKVALDARKRLFTP